MEDTAGVPTPPTPTAKPKPDSKKNKGELLAELAEMKTAQKALAEAEAAAAAAQAEPEAVPAPSVPAVEDELGELKNMFKQLMGVAKTQAGEMATLKAQLKTLKADTPRGRLEAEGKPSLRDDVMHVRVKPYNKRRGHLRGRQFVNELDQVFIGGTGKLGSVPRWYEVDPVWRAALEDYRQNYENPESPCVFDICSADERRRIDQAEETMRLGQAGIGAPPGVTRGIRATTESTSPRPSPPPANAPSMADGAEVFVEEAPEPQLPAVMEGRAAALEGVEPGVKKKAQRTSTVGTSTGSNRDKDGRVIDYGNEPDIDEMVPAMATAEAGKQQLVDNTTRAHR